MTAYVSCEQMPEKEHPDCAHICLQREPPESSGEGALKTHKLIIEIYDKGE